MVNFLHSFSPQPILLSWGFITIYWYGFFMVLAMAAAIGCLLALARHYHIKSEPMIDLAFYLILGGVLGARLYEILINWPYYFSHPLNALKIWEGGLAIHGSIIFGLLILFLFSRHHKFNFWFLGALAVPSVALGQAIGRWGNYFNQEIFGLPTSLPWGIPISIINRPLEFIDQKYYHPVFLYESFGNLLIFLVLIAIHVIILGNIKKKQTTGNNIYLKIVCWYLLLYSALRFFLEFIRLDATPEIGNWRWPQIISLTIIALSIIVLSFHEKIIVATKKEK